MKRSILLCSLLPALWICFALPSGSADEGDKKSAGPEGAQITALIEKLGSEDYEEREAAYMKLEELGEKARPHLKKVLESDDLEVRWRASKLLSLLDRQKEKARILEGKELQEDILTSMMRRLDELERNLSKERSEWDDDMDRFDELFGKRLDKFWGRGPFFKFDFFDDDYFGPLDQLMEELKKNKGGLRFEIGGSKVKYSMERRDDEGREKLSLTVDEEGSVKAVITRFDNEDKKLSERVYEAESLDAFKKSYPDVVERFGLDKFSLGFRMPDMKWNWNLPRAFETRKRPDPILPPPSDSQKTLGILVDPAGPGRVLRAHLGLEEGVGIVVDQVLQGTFASKVGLKPMDVITSINGEKVGNALDVRDILSRVKDGQKVEITLIRNGGKKRLSGNL